MKHAISALAAVVALVLTTVCLFVALQGHTADAAEPCHINISVGGIGVVVCGGDIIGQIPLPTIRVSVPGPTIRLPAPTRTVTLPRATRTVEIPGPVQTRTISVPGPTRTVSVPPRTITAGPTQGPLPTTTVTATATASVTETTQATPLPQVPTTGPFERGFNFIKGGGTVTKVGLSLLALLIICGLLLLAMYAGYILGFKDKEARETNFMRSLLDQAKIRH